MTYVIAGATGNTGRVIVNNLLEAGKAVRALVHSPGKGADLKERGAEVRVVDLTDARSLGEALADARGAYLLVPPTFTAPNFRAYQDRTTDAIVSPVSTARVPEVAFLSSLGAEHASGTGPIAGLHYAENELRKLTHTRTTFIRAGYFMENLALNLSLLGQGLLTTFLPKDLPVHMVATVDIGTIAASVLMKGSNSTRVLQVVGPKPVSHTDAAAALSRITGRPIAVAEGPVAEMAKTLNQAGVPLDLAELYREMTQALIAGRVTLNDGEETARGGTEIETVLRHLVPAA